MMGNTVSQPHFCFWIIPTGMRHIVLLLLFGYRKFVSPLFPPNCRFVPTCSEYAFQAISRFGLIKGCYLAAKRIVRCHPWGGHGYDPVPDDWQ